MCSALPRTLRSYSWKRSPLFKFKFAKDDGCSLGRAKVWFEEQGLNNFSVAGCLRSIGLSGLEIAVWKFDRPGNVVVLWTDICSVVCDLRFAEYRLGNVKASVVNWMDRQAIVVSGGVDQWEPCQVCTMSGSGTVTRERETTKLSRGVLTIDFVGRLGAE